MGGPPEQIWPLRHAPLQAHLPETVRMECSRRRESLRHTPPTSLCLANGLPCPFSWPRRMGWRGPLLCPLLRPGLLARRDGHRDGHTRAAPARGTRARASRHFCWQMRGRVSEQSSIRGRRVPPAGSDVPSSGFWQEARPLRSGLCGGLGMTSAQALCGGGGAAPGAEGQGWPCRPGHQSRVAR